MNAETPNRGWVYLVFGCLAAAILLGCCLVVPCVGCCGFSAYIGNIQSEDVEVQVAYPKSVRAGQPFDMGVTVTNSTGSDDTLAISVITDGGILEFVSAQPAPDLDVSSAFGINLSYTRIRAGESKTITLRLRATGQGQMPITVRGNVGILKGRSTTVNVSIQP